MWVSPFRDLRLFGYLLLPVAFRSLSRLSSALSAKASTLRSYSLNLVSIALDTLGRVHLSMLVFTSSFFDQKPSLLTPRMSFLFSMNSSGFPSLVHGFDLRFCIRFSRYFSDNSHDMAHLAAWALETFGFSFTDILQISGLSCLNPLLCASTVAGLSSQAAAC